MGFGRGMAGAGATGSAGACASGTIVFRIVSDRVPRTATVIRTGAGRVEEKMFVSVAVDPAVQGYVKRMVVVRPRRASGANVAPPSLKT